ncbi:hypothetical protein LGQ02_01605 [Bacillus shivajii]|uniref:hypothetical protein n=1 Tax=Bacillus shivajii TaxID=1983719 RepID=UPI001CFA2E67|nr:hypothetical protein [Bacillus shivajii]UCZ53523.1 hypothetical protein LGQ02_01605 [Bacillus shivajii]
MKQNSIVIFIIPLILFSIIFPGIAFANSSWQWLTDSPMTLLPYAILFTLAVEILAILVFGQLVKNLSLKIKAMILIIVANLASFLLPYLFRALEVQAVAGSWENAWFAAFEAGPFYIVLTGYLFMTLLVEVPIIYFFLKKHTTNNRILFIVIVSANILTTAAIAAIERMMFYGHW